MREGAAVMFRLHALPINARRELQILHVCIVFMRDRLDDAYGVDTCSCDVFRCNLHRNYMLCRCSSDVNYIETTSKLHVVSM